MLNPYLETKKQVFDDIVKFISEPLVPEPTETRFQVSLPELDKCVEFFHTTLQKYGQQVVQRIGQV